MRGLRKLLLLQGSNAVRNKKARVSRETQNQQKERNQ